MKVKDVRFVGVLAICLIGGACTAPDTPARQLPLEGAETTPITAFVNGESEPYVTLAGTDFNAPDKSGSGVVLSRAFNGTVSLPKTAVHNRILDVTGIFRTNFSDTPDSSGFFSRISDCNMVRTGTVTDYGVGCSDRINVSHNNGCNNAVYAGGNGLTVVQHACTNSIDNAATANTPPSVKTYFINVGVYGAVNSHLQKKAGTVSDFSNAFEAYLDTSESQADIVTNVALYIVKNDAPAGAKRYGILDKTGDNWALASDEGKLLFGKQESAAIYCDGANLVINASLDGSPRRLVVSGLAGDGEAQVGVDAAGRLCRSTKLQEENAALAAQLAELSKEVAALRQKVAEVDVIQEKLKALETRLSATQ